MKIALTHSEGRLEGLEPALRERGFEVTRVPLIRTEPVDAAAVCARVPELLDCPWLLFASPSAVAAWHALRLPFSDRYIGAVGEDTAERVRQACGTVRLIGWPATAVGLARTFLSDPEAAGPVALPCGDRARPTLLRQLAAAGFESRPLTVYRTHVCPWPEEVQTDVIFLASPSAARALPDAACAHARLVAIGPTTGEALVQRGYPYEQAARPAIEAILHALMRCV